MIELTDKEAALLGQISLDPLIFSGNVAGFTRNGELVAQLMASLIERKGIPQPRVAYFLDPECNPGGRGKSKKDVFVRSGTPANEIFRHGNFLGYLRYFLNGPDLPQSLIASFREEVEGCGPITSGDITTLTSCARRLARTYGLDTSDADEFFKLALDCGLTQTYAMPIRDAVKSIRR